MSICRVLYVKLSWVICTMKHLLFISLKLTSWEKNCCIQNHMQTFLSIFRAKAPALLCGKSLHGHWHVRKINPKTSFFFPAFYRTEPWKEVGFSKDTYAIKCGSHNVFRSSWESFWVSTAIQLQTFFFASRTSLSKCDYEKTSSPLPQYMHYFGLQAWTWQVPTKMGM